MPKLFESCVDCSDEFCITEKSQEFFVSKGLALPKRCYGCRQQKKQRQAQRSPRSAVVAAPQPQEDLVEFFARDDDERLRKDGAVRRRRHKIRRARD